MVETTNPEVVYTSLKDVDEYIKEKFPNIRSEKRDLKFNCLCPKCNKVHASSYRNILSGIKKHGEGFGFYCGTCKNKQSLLENHGDENWHNIALYKERSLAKYGTINAGASKEAIEKRKKTSLEKFGVECYFSTKESVRKIKKSKKENHGDENYTNREKIVKTLLDRYGVTSTVKIPGVLSKISKRYIYKDIFFASSWELAFWIYCEDNNLPIKKCDKSFKYYSDYYKKERSYFPDFEVDDQIYEIKGGHLKEDGLDNSWEDKLKICREQNIIIISSDKIGKYLSFIKEKYGNDYLKQFRRMNKEVSEDK